MIVVATTLAAFAMADTDIWSSWLKNAEAIAETHDVRFFAAIEIDARGVEPFRPLLDRLEQVKGDHWVYLLDDGRTEITTPNRQLHLTMGENLCSAYATNEEASHLLFCAADCTPPPDVLPKLLEVLDRKQGVVGAECPTYGLHGPILPEFGSIHVEEQLASAACIMLSRQVFKQLKWRCDPDLGLTDDPALQHDAKNLLGLRSMVRKDCVAKHWPETIGPVENRIPGRDMKVYR